jgi:hypothetical protein
MDGVIPVLLLALATGGIAAEAVPAPDRSTPDATVICPCTIKKQMFEDVAERHVRAGKRRAAAGPAWDNAVSPDEADYVAVERAYGSGQPSEAGTLGQRFLERHAASPYEREVRILLGLSLLGSGSPSPDVAAMSNAIASFEKASSGAGGGKAAEEAAFLVVYTLNASGSHRRTLYAADTFLRRYPRGRYTIPAHILAAMSMEEADDRSAARDKYQWILDNHKLNRDYRTFVAQRIALLGEADRGEKRGKR